MRCFWAAVFAWFFWFGSLAMPQEPAWIPVEPTVFGAWSQPVDGLRARFSAGAKPPPIGARHVALYLELQNVGGSEVISIKNPVGRLTVRVQRGAVELGPELRSAEITTTTLKPLLPIPLGSTIRLDLTVTGWGENPEGRGLALSVRDGFWLFPASKLDEYSVTALLDFPAAEDVSQESPVWAGRLEIPPLSLKTLAE